MPEQFSVPPLILILELDVPLASNCKVLVRLMVPLMVMMSPATADATADFNAASVVTVVLFAATNVGSAALEGAAFPSSANVAVSVCFWHEMNAMQMPSTTVLVIFFIMVNLIVNKIVTATSTSR
jgi:hypothetical protein